MQRRVTICDLARSTFCAELGCSTTKLVPRPTSKDHKATTRKEQTTSRCSIHFRSVASSDTVIKSRLDRDRIALGTGTIACELEGAGICRNMPTIVIKSICDYFDSHKDKVWQEYAAVTATACTKAVLHE